MERPPENQDGLRACPFCGSDDARLVFDKSGYPNGICCGGCHALVKWPAREAYEDWSPRMNLWIALRINWNKRGGES